MARAGGSAARSRRGRDPRSLRRGRLGRSVLSHGRRPDTGLFSPEEIARKRSANPKHLQRLKPRPGYIHAAPPLDVCQIDHTPTDINFVEVVDGGGTFIGRAYLTIVTDVATRCILGFCLTLEKPSALSVALCLAHAMCPREAWLAARGIEHGWPMFGRPRSLVTDSAKEFKGNAFQRGCEDYGIRIHYRNRRRVHQGGVVERPFLRRSPALPADPWRTATNIPQSAEPVSASPIWSDASCSR